MRWWRKKSREHDLDRELRSDLELEIEEQIEHGMAPEEARSAALRAFGNTTFIKEGVREMWGWTSVERLWQDLRYAARTLRNTPVFTSVALLSLALGIGANTAIFTLVDQILLRLLPVDEPRRLVQLAVDGGRFGSNTGDGEHTFSYPAYLSLRDRNTVFSGLTGERVERASLIAGERAEMVSVGMVAGNYFQVLGVPPQIGRLLTPDDDKVRNAHPLAILEHDFWRSRFAASPTIVGSSIRLNGFPFTVIGVAAPRFQGTIVATAAQIWVPVAMKTVITPTWDGMADERYTWFYLFGRLKPHISIREAQAAIRVLYRQLQQQELGGDYFQKFPEARSRFLRQSFTLETAARGQSWIRSNFERPLIILQLLVGLVLLIACVNLANLLLTRAAARQREIAIRGSLGASRARLIRQFLCESLVLAACGAAGGLMLSSWIIRGLIRILPFDPNNLALSTSPDLRILAFTAGIGIATVLFFGLTPAVQGSRVTPGISLKEGAGSLTAAQGHVRLRKIFVALQIALSCVLLLCAGLFARTLQNLKNVDLGFRVENVITFGIRPAMPYDRAHKLLVYRSLIEGLKTVPGVRAAGANRERLLTGGRSDGGITMADVRGSDENAPSSFFNAVTPGYFDALGIPIKRGRDLRWSDWGSPRKLGLVNEAFVNDYLDGANPVGRMVAQGEKRNPDIEIIGVFGNAKYDDVRGPVPRQVFMSLDSKIDFVNGINVYVRARGNGGQLMSELRDQVRRVDANLVVSDMRTLDEQVNLRVSNERLLAFLSAGFAVLANLLAVVGLYGVLAYVVAGRTRELGIRMALGARRADVIRLVIQEMLPVNLVGIAAGAVIGLVGGRYLESQLFGVKANDPGVFVLTIATLLLAAGSAAFVPAWRAARIDPVQALRYE